MPEQTNLAHVAPFSWPCEAYLAASKLNDEGINSVVVDEYMVSANWLWSQAVGGVKLFVEQSNHGVAMEALAADRSDLFLFDIECLFADIPGAAPRDSAAFLPSRRAIVREAGFALLVLYYTPIPFAFMLGFPVVGILTLLKCWAPSSTSTSMR